MPTLDEGNLLVQPVMTMGSGDDGLRKLQDQVDLILASHELGRSPKLARLLDFLLTNALQDRAPKEAEIAEAVLSRLPTEREADASVRVYVHRLRRKLNDFYAGPGHDQHWRLVLPKGSYKLGVEHVDSEDQDGDPAQPPMPPAHAAAGEKARWGLWVAGAAMLVVASVAGWIVGAWHRDPGQIETVQRSALWQPVLDGDHRVALVLGDYYIFGERDDQGNVGRLIRQFDVNSAGDLDELKMADPAANSRYENLDLAYLPVGVGAALRFVSPVLGTGAPVVQVTTASQLSVQTVQNTSLVYLGYISGLGILRSAMLDGSRFAIGDSFDEIVDHKTGRHYLASSHLEASDVPGEDYALISSFKGVAGNRIIIIAGTRDAALMQAAEFVTRPATLGRLDSVARDGQPFEALLGISAMRNVGLQARLITISARPNPTWSNDSGASFPDEFPAPSAARSSKAR